MKVLGRASWDSGAFNFDLLFVFFSSIALCLLLLQVIMVWDEKMEKSKHYTIFGDQVKIDGDFKKFGTYGSWDTDGNFCQGHLSQPNM